jgi:pilus assembly protein Flp/PilA
MLHFVARFLQDESGPTAVEYAVILAFFVMAIIASIKELGGTTSSIWSTNVDEILAAFSGV